MGMFVTTKLFCLFDSFNILFFFLFVPLLMIFLFLFIFRGTNSIAIYLRSVIAVILPLTLYICLWQIVLNFYSEITSNDERASKFVSNEPDSKTIEKFMTEDEYHLTKKNLKINARALKENDTIL